MEVSGTIQFDGIIDGKDGDDAVTYDIVFTEAWAKATPKGVITARLRGHAYKIEGNNRTPFNGATIRYGYNPDDNDTYVETRTSSKGYFDAGTWFDGDELDDYAKGSAVVFASIIVDGKAVCTKYVTIVQEAADGKAGHVGRWYYYAGEWKADETYAMQETQAPFVKRGDKFYMLDFAAYPSYQASDAVRTSIDDDPADTDFQNGKPWTLMQSTMQYYIAQAFFGPYAHFGSFIINGDWMISQYGTLIDSSGTRITVNANNVSLQYGGKIPYAWFDPADPTAVSNPQSGSYKFIPNFAVDGLTGKTYQNNAYIRGEIYAENGVFQGTVRATNFFNKICYFYDGGTCIGGDGTHTKGDKSYAKAGMADIIMMMPNTTSADWKGTLNSGTVLLPDPESCDGKMVTVFCHAITASGTPAIGCVANNKFVGAWRRGNTGLTPDGPTSDTLTLGHAFMLQTFKYSSGSIVHDSYRWQPSRVVLVAQNGYWFKLE